MSTENYSLWSRVLHQLALGNNLLPEVSFDVERMLFPVEHTDIVDNKHVFVIGLARAGTTILMRQLYQTNAYRSLTYRDMPFVLAPNLWQKLSSISHKNKAAEMRAHEDGIEVDFDSPEALEEVFWRAHCGSDYIYKDRLVPLSFNQEVGTSFIDYISLVMRSHPGRCYLSKNNNNVLRIPGILSCFPNAAVLIPFREPLQHANSLMLQHQHFLEQHKKHPFSRKYMNWLAHHEFGIDHRPFLFNDLQCNKEPMNSLETNLNYWMELWLNTYKFVVETAPDNCIFISYERFCDETAIVWPHLCSILDLPVQPLSSILRKSEKTIRFDVSEKLYANATDLYEIMRKREIW